MDVIGLHNKGLSQREISRKLGISRPTVRKYIEDPSGIGQYQRTEPRPSLLDPYADIISSWIEEDPHYKATWIYDRLVPMGFTGSYEIVKRLVSRLKTEAQRVAYIRFETEPGRQAQVDFGEFQVEQPDGNVRKLYLFAMIMGYSRKIYAEFITRCDLPAFLDGHVHAFTHFGGVPAEILYDRMKNVYIRVAPPYAPLQMTRVFPMGSVSMFPMPSVNGIPIGSVNRNPILQSLGNDQASFFNWVNLKDSPSRVKILA